MRPVQAAQLAALALLGNAALDYYLSNRPQLQPPTHPHPATGALQPSLHKDVELANQIAVVDAELEAELAAYSASLRAAAAAAIRAPPATVQEAPRPAASVAPQFPAELPPAPSSRGNGNLLLPLPPPLQPDPTLAARVKRLPRPMAQETSPVDPPAPPQRGLISAKAMLGSNFEAPPADSHIAVYTR